MSDYKKLKTQIAALERQAEAARSKEKTEVLANIKGLMSDYDISVKDLGAFAKSSSKANGKTRRTRAPSTPKYQDPKTGATWSGMGKPPKWIALAAKRGRKDDFLIGAPKAAPSPTDSKVKAPKAKGNGKPVNANPAKAAAKKKAVPAKKATSAVKNSVTKEAKSAD